MRKNYFILKFKCGSIRPFGIKASLFKKFSFGKETTVLAATNTKKSMEKKLRELERDIFINNLCKKIKAV